MDCSPEYVDNYFGIYDNLNNNDVDSGAEDDDEYNTKYNSATNLTKPATSKRTIVIAKCHSFDQGGLFEYHIVPREPFSLEQQMKKYLGTFDYLLKRMSQIQLQLEGANDRLASVRERQKLRYLHSKKCSIKDNQVTQIKNMLARIKEEKQKPQSVNCQNYSIEDNKVTRMKYKLARIREERQKAKFLGTIKPCIVNKEEKIKDQDKATKF